LKGAIGQPSEGVVQSKEMSLICSFCWGPHLKLCQELPLHLAGFDLP